MAAPKSSKPKPSSGMAKRKAYKGGLAQPIPHIPFPGYTLGLLSERDPAAAQEGRERVLKQWQNSVVAAQMEKMRLLFAHYNIPDGDYGALAVTLAIAHVPGLSIAKARAGAPTVWMPLDLAAVRFYLDELRRANPRLSDAQAAGKAAKSGIWLSRSRRALSGATLLRRAADADSRWVSVLRDAYQYAIEGESPRTVSTPEEFVRKWLAPNFSIGGNPPETISA